MEFKLIHLPAENTDSIKSGIYIDSDGKLHPHNVTNGGKMCHLYITYVGEVEYGDYFIGVDNTITKYLDFDTKISSPKIFASTDKSLPFLMINRMLIHLYIKRQGYMNTIDRYLLREYTHLNRSIDPISKEQIYSKEEVLGLCEKAYHDASPMMKEVKQIKIDWNKWKSKNL